MSSDRMRAEFESWARTQPYLAYELDRYSEAASARVAELYQNDRTQMAWENWQAAYHAGMERAAKVCDGLSNDWIESSEREYSRDAREGK